MNIKTIISFACLASLVACSPKDPKNPKFVVASFKGGEITRAELSAREGELLASRGGKLEDIPAEYAAKIDWDVANRMVLDKILASQVSKLKSQIAPAIDAELAEVKKSVNGDEQEFQKRLVERGLTEQDFRNSIAQQEAIRYLISQEKDAPAPVTEADAKAFYDANPQYFQEEEVYNLRYIEIPLPEKATAADKKQAQAKAAAAHKRVSGGENFEKVAKEHDTNNPQAGVTQPIHANQFSPEFGKIVKKLKPGAVSPVQEIGNMLLILQVTEIQPAKVTGFDEVKSAIIRNLRAQKEEPFARRILEKLRDDAKIKFNIPDPTKEAAAPATPKAPEAAEKK